MEETEKENDTCSEKRLNKGLEITLTIVPGSTVYVCSPACWRWG
jgi:hypothetical protein